MKLIVGLGNPGEYYLNTRHNLGFRFLDKFVLENKLGEFKEKFNGMYLKTKVNNQDVIFLKPLSFMNLSGEVVIKFVNYYKINPQDVLVLHDDLDLPLGTYKLRSQGSSGGHNGIKNIILYLGDNFKRLKIGISNNKEMDTKDYVLGHFSKEENEILEKVEPKIMKIIDEYFKVSFNSLMANYNRRG